MPVFILIFFFFNDTATTEIYTLSLHDALPICRRALRLQPRVVDRECLTFTQHDGTLDHVLQLTHIARPVVRRSEEHTSELQSHSDLVCRLLLEKKKHKFTHSARLRHDVY